MSKTLNQTLAEVECTQAELIETIEASKKLLDRSQQLLDCHKKKQELRQSA